ncbi:exostosin family protein [Actinidia rufa]|uniref:Exostosin family protein n=1 Tax=Actinidia rufa TaxID=165716 RepID=A0A7J0E4S2_9ERIC|nr:exostosin family protein [Actinidia rufa]
MEKSITKAKCQKQFCLLKIRARANTSIFMISPPDSTRTFSRIFRKQGLVCDKPVHFGTDFPQQNEELQVCLTNDSQMASAIYVPFYAGLDIGRYLWGFNSSVKDSASIDLEKWLFEKPEWGYLSGRDHFFVAGRVNWDFNRVVEEDSGWGNKLMLLPHIKNTTSLIIESSPWTEREIAIPYPTYFHPSTDVEVFQYQEKLRRLRRKYLFSFAGAPRPTRIDSIRGEIIDQCIASGRKCKFLNCTSGSETCENPICVMGMFKKSSFCLQPPGDSYTRRSTFDSILGGCIPAFFNPASAYTQYIWHLPQNFTKYSVFIPENDIKNRNTSIEVLLGRIPKEEVEAMREEVVRLIPKVLYAHPTARLETIEDAFDIAVKGVLDRVENIRKAMKAGKKLY